MNRAALATLGWLLLVTPAMSQDELLPVEPELAQDYAKLLNQVFEKAQGVQVPIDLDVDKAQGLGLGTEGILIVPHKGVDPDPEAIFSNPAAQAEKGAPLAVIFMSPRFNPLIDGKPAEEGVLRTLTFIDGAGIPQPGTALVLSVHTVNAGERRLRVYGIGEQPIIDARLGDSVEIPDEAEIATVSVKDVKDNKATLVVRMCSLYTASFEIGHNLEGL